MPEGDDKNSAEDRHGRDQKDEARKIQAFRQRGSVTRARDGHPAHRALSLHSRAGRDEGQ